MANKFNTSNSGDFVEYFSPTKLFEKIGKYSKKAGVKSIYAALLLYYALTSDEVPLKDKAIVIGALGYFIFPFDFIPDILGPFGYTDDTAAMLLALKTIWDNITPSTHEKARRRLNEWFDDIDPEDLKLF